MSWRLLRVLAWLQWRLTVNRVLESGKRDSVERASRIAEIALKVLVALLLLPAALVVACAGAFAGWTLAARGEAAGWIGTAATAAAGVPLVWVAIRPFFAMGEAGSGATTLLRLLPVPRAVFRNLELLRSALDPIVLLFAAGVLLLPLGMIAGGAVAGGLLAAAAGVLLLMTVAALGSAVSLGVQLIARRRGRAELVTVVFLLLLMSAGLLPQLMIQQAPAGQTGHPSRPTAVEREQAATLPTVVRYSPPGCYGTAIAGSAALDLHAALPALGLLLATAGVLILASQAMLDRLLTTAPSGGGRAGHGVLSAGRTSAALANPVLALAVAETRAHLRTVRGKVAVISPALMMPLMAIAFRHQAAGASFMSLGPMPVAFLALFGPASAAVFSVNQFAVIRGGQLLESILPVSTRTMLTGKLLASTAVVALAAAAGAVSLELVDAEAQLAFVVAAVLAGLSAHIALTPLAAVLSAVFPKPVELAAIGRGAQPHGLAVAVNLAATLAAIAPAAGLGVGAFLLTRQPWAVPVAVTIALVLAAGLARLALPLAARIVAARTENIILVASGR